MGRPDSGGRRWRIRPRLALVVDEHRFRLSEADCRQLLADLLALRLSEAPLRPYPRVRILDLCAPGEYSSSGTSTSRKGS